MLSGCGFQHNAHLWFTICTAALDSFLVRQNPDVILTKRTHRLTRLPGELPKEVHLHHSCTLPCYSIRDAYSRATNLCLTKFPSDPHPLFFFSQKHASSLLIPLQLTMEGLNDKSRFILFGTVKGLIPLLHDWSSYIEAFTEVFSKFILPYHHCWLLKPTSVLVPQPVVKMHSKTKTWSKTGFYWFCREFQTGYVILPVRYFTFKYKAVQSFAFVKW